MANRADLLAELDTALDGSGDYTGPWLDSSGIFRVRVVNTGSGLRIEESNDQTNVVQVNTSAVAAEGLPWAQEEISITARYYRIRGFGDPNAPLHAAVRDIS